MKSFIVLIAVACTLAPETVDAGCRVNCNRVVVAEQFVAVPAAIVTGVPVATYGAVGYQYTPQQPVNVTVNINADDIANKVVQRLNASDQQPPAPLPNPPPVPSAEQPGPVQSRSAPQAPVQPDKPNADHESFIQGYRDWYSKEAPKFATAVSTNCAKCHAPGRNAAAVAHIDLSNLAALTCEQRLAASGRCLR